MSVVVPMERDPHAVAQALLPWYVRAQLDDAEMAEVQAHLQACPGCRAELAAEQALLELPAQPPGGDIEAGLARMRARIRHGEAPAPRPAGPPRWLAWTLGLQSGAIVALLLLLAWPRAELPSYRGLAADAAGPAAQALIMFKPDASERQIRAALQAGGATLIGGPTESHAYLLRLPSEGRQAALQRLRAQPIVTLAEPLDAGAAR